MKSTPTVAILWYLLTPRLILVDPRNVSVLVGSGVHGADRLQTSVRANDRKIDGQSEENSPANSETDGKTHVALE